MSKTKIVIFLAAIFAFIKCSDSSLPTDTERSSSNYSEELAKIFPYSLSQKYEFKIDTLNHNDGLFETKGTRLMWVSSNENIGKLNYYLCDQQYHNSGSVTTLKTKYRISNKSILILTDTTNVTKSIPDSLVKIMTINVDPEIFLVNFPLKKNEPWPVVKAVVDFQTFKFTTIEVIAEYIGTEVIFLDSFKEQIKTEKIKYRIDINVPNYDNPFLSNTKRYFADIWFAEEKGIVKMEGCTFILNPLIGQYMDFADTNRVSRHTLTKIN